MSHNIKVIIGANYGDEGKGFVTNYLADQTKDEGKGIVVLSNGGPQRGHTVHMEGKPRTVFHHLGSASYQGFDTYFPRDFIINPAVFNRELSEFQDKDRIRVFVNDYCRFTTPYDMELNQQDSRKQGIHNSCGMGIWNTQKRYARLPSLTWERFINTYDYTRESHLYSYYDFSAFIAHTNGLPRLYSADLMSAVTEYFHADCMEMANTCELTRDNHLFNYKTILFENGQGLGLDQNIKGQENYTTPSNTGIANPLEIIESVFDGEEVEIVYVTRSYLTRHGSGPMDNEDKSLFFEDKTNMPNEFQGGLRFGRLDVDKMLTRIKKDVSLIPPNTKNRYNVSVAMTHLNEIRREDDIEKIKKNVDQVYLF